MEESNMNERKSKGIKNPFGNPDEMTSGMTANPSSQNLRSQGDQEEYIKNELAKRGITEDSINFGLNMGKQLVKNSKFVDYFSLDGLKPYFHVDNKYVLNKLGYIFIPFLKPKDANENNEMQQQTHPNPERFDLYLPMMSFITYVLVISFNIAFNNAKIFGPQILGRILTKDFSLYIINALLLKLTMFIFLKNTLSFLDIVSLVGYKFILITVFIEPLILFEQTIIRNVIFGVISLFSILFVRRCLNKHLVEEKFKKTTKYITFALEVFVLFFVVLDIPYYVNSGKKQAEVAPTNP